MFHLSKKQLPQFTAALSVPVAAALLCFPSGVSAGDPTTLWVAALCAAAALSLGHLASLLGPPPSCLRPLPLLPIAVPAAFVLRLRPDELGVLLALFPFALLLLHHRAGAIPRSRVAVWTSRFLILWIGATGLLHTAHVLPPRPTPRLPYYTGFWVTVLFLLPLGFASRQVLRPFAKALLRYEILILLTLAYLGPPVWTAATSLKSPGEPARHFLSLTPGPRYFLDPGTRIDGVVPERLRDHSRARDILRALDEMTWHLSRPGLRTAFPDNAPLPPDEMIRAMKLYGYLEEDLHGFFVSETSFVREPPPAFDPDNLQWVRHLHDHAGFTPTEIADALGLDPGDAESLLLQMRRLELTDRVPGPDPVYRLTSQGRYPFTSGLRPRQLLLLTREPARPVQIDRDNYAPRWELEFEEVRAELNQLVDLGKLRRFTGIRFDNYGRLLDRNDLWRACGRYVVAVLLALLVGYSLPTVSGLPLRLVTTAAGLLLLAPLPVAFWLRGPAAVGLALWILRLHRDLSSTRCTRYALFGAAILLSLLPANTLPLDAPLVTRAAWATLWMPISLAFLILAIRPLRESNG